MEMEIVQRAIRGDHQAILSLIEMDEDILYRMAFTYLKNEQDAFKKYWAIENGERSHPSYDTNAIVEWLNNVRFKRGIAKAKLITNPLLRAKKTLYF